MEPIDMPPGFQNVALRGETPLRKEADPRSAQAVRQLEGVFLNMVFEEMAKTAPEGGLFEPTPGEQLAHSWFRTEIAERWAKNGGVGLSGPIADAAGIESASFRSPVAGQVTSGFGPRRHPVTGEHDHHDGVDIAAPVGTPVRSPFAGRVVEVKDHDRLGQVVVVEHAGGYRSVYGHLDSAAVTPGTVVGEGQIIAHSGASGRTTGPHLHFGLYRNARAVDPGQWIPELRGVGSTTPNNKIDGEASSF